jgi:hypothetical protein
MQDQPTARELTESIAQFLETEILPTLDDARLKFRTRVAINLLHILAREISQTDAQLRAESERLYALMNTTPRENSRADIERMTREFARRIRAGEADQGAFHDAVVAHVEQTVIEKLEIANPRYLERTAKERASYET